MTLDMFSTSRDGAVVREAQAARDAGIAQAEETAGPNWNEEADLALRAYAESHAEVFVDDVHASTGGRFVSKAFGSVMQRAAKRGWIEKSGQYRPSVQSNLQVKPVWSSRLFRGAR